MHITKSEIQQYLRTPYTMQDMFFIETLNAAFSILESILENISSQHHLKVSLNKLKKHIWKEIIKFHNTCLQCENECFYRYHKNLHKDIYKQMNIDDKDLPKKFRKKTGAHFYMLELDLGITDATMNYLRKYIQDEDVFGYIHNSLFFSILDYFEDRCINHCNYQCFKHCYQSAYCYICQLIDDNLACPLKGEVKIRDIGEDDFPAECSKK